MTDMPETIWIKDDPGHDLFDLVWHTTDESVRPCIQYTRTDTIPQVKVKPLADAITKHLDISTNHEAGLIPVATQTLLRDILSAIEGEG